MSKFKRHSRFDSDLAETGVWFSVKDELGNHYGDFLCSLIDQHATHTKLRAQRATKGRPDRQGQNTDAAKVVAELLVTLSVTDWDGVCYADGKPVEFTRANAVEFFTEETFVAQQVLEYAQNVANYQPASVDDIVKN